MKPLKNNDQRIERAVAFKNLMKSPDFAYLTEEFQSYIDSSLEDIRDESLSDKDLRLAQLRFNIANDMYNLIGECIKDGDAANSDIEQDKNHKQNRENTRTPVN